MEFLTSDHRRNPKSHPKRRPLRRLRNLESSRSEVANAKFLSPTIHMSRRSLQTDQITPYRQALGAAPFRLQIPILTPRESGPGVTRGCVPIKRGPGATFSDP